MEGPPRASRKQESVAGKLARAVALGAALHAETAAAGMWPETISEPAIEEQVVETESLTVRDLLNVKSNYHSDLIEVFSRATPEQKGLIKQTLVDASTMMNEYVHGAGDPNILLMQEIVRDVQKTGEMGASRGDGAVLPFDDPEKYAAFEAARDAASKIPLKPEEMQKITIENASQAQIENWIRSIKLPPRLWPE